jgi:hypothetical protein
MAEQAIGQERSQTLSHWGLRGLAAAVGAAIWAVAVWTVVSGPAHPGDLEVVLRCLPVLAAVALAATGWDWLSAYRFGSYGSLVKLLALIGIAATGVGLVAISYWTGRSVLRTVAARVL